MNVVVQIIPLMYTFHGIEDGELYDFALLRGSGTDEVEQLLDHQCWTFFMFFEDICDLLVQFAHANLLLVLNVASKITFR